MTIRQERVSSAIKRLAGEFLKTEAGKDSLITPISADISKDLKNATIYVSIFPENQEPNGLKFLKRKRTDFRNFFKNNIKIKTIPFFDFEIDSGEKNRQRIEELSTK